MQPRKTERASATQRAIGALIILVVALAGAYLLYSRLWTPPTSTSIASVRLGNDTVAIKGRLSDYGGTANKPAELLLLHVRCGAAIIELDAASRTASPAGKIDANGRFSIETKIAFLAKITRTGLRANGVALDEAHQDFLVLGFFAPDKLALLLGADGKPLRISPQGEILNAGDLRISSTAPPTLIVTRNPDGGTRVGGGGLVFDHSC
jgi:hypothetical protein